MVHEVGHALGLPHDARRSDLYFMGDGFRNFQRLYARDITEEHKPTFSVENGRILGRSRFLTGNVELFDFRRPSAEMKIEGPLSTESTSVTVNLKLRDNAGLSSLLVFAFNQDGVIGGSELKGTGTSLKLTLPLRKPTSGLFRLEAYVTDVGGNLTRVVSQSTVRGK